MACFTLMRIGSLFKLYSLWCYWGFHEKGTHSYLCTYGWIDSLHWMSVHQVPFIWNQLYLNHCPAVLAHILGLGCVCSGDVPTTLGSIPASHNPFIPALSRLVSASIQDVSSEGVKQPPIFVQWFLRSSHVTYPCQSLTNLSLPNCHFVSLPNLSLPNLSLPAYQIVINKL